MTYHVLITARARADAVEALRWIADRSPAAGNRWYLGLAKAIAGLEQSPEKHPVAEDETAQLGFALRQKLYGRRKGIYRLLFSIEGDTVVVHYIRHTARGQIET